MKYITPHLWFDKEAKEATAFYTSLFPDSKVTNVTTITGTPSGHCDIVSFELIGAEIHGDQRGPVFQIHPRDILPREMRDQG
jgi:predicted 3-demethylubiquinone-9 3-methyltransferase (glyoxalase superfamily)